MISVPFSRAVSSAASLMTFARSAPDIPTVRLASASKSTSGANGLPLECTEDRPAAGEVRRADRDLAVEPAGPQQRGVQDVRPVRRGDQDDVGAGVEAVHLDEQLVQRLLALVVPAAQAGAALAADRVDLVDEDDARGVLLGLLEQVAHPGGADTDEHLDEVRAGDRVERHARLTGDGPRQQRLAGAGRPVQQHALRDLRAEGLVAARVLQEVLDLVQLLDRLVRARHVRERRLRHVLVELLRARLAEAHHPVPAALGVVHHPEQDEQHQAQRDEVDQHRDQERLLAHGGVELGLVRSLLQRGEDLRAGVDRVLRDDLRAAVDGLVQRQAEALFLVFDQRLADVAALDLRQRDRRGLLLEATRVVEEHAEREVDQDRGEDPDQWIAEQTLAVHAASASVGLPP